jgi:hypothetical protein
VVDDSDEDVRARTEGDQSFGKASREGTPTDDSFRKRSRKGTPTRSPFF